MSFTWQFCSWTCVLHVLFVMRHNKRWKAYCFFLWCIPQWPRTHMKVPEIQALLLLFPNIVFVFSRVWLNCSLCVLEFKLSQHICGQVCTEFTEFGKHRGGSQFSYRLLFSVTSLLLAENEDGPCSQPCKVWSSGTSEDQLCSHICTVFSYSHIYKFFPTVMCQGERPVPGLPSRP